MIDSKKILITGATGFIGGSVLKQLLESHNQLVKNCKISALVRGQTRADTLSSLGVTPILFDNLDQSDVLEKVASEHDIVIHTATGFHTSSAVALIRGLGKRKNETGKDVHYIHTTGTSNLADQPITGAYHESREFCDTDDDIHAYLQMRESKVAYPQRTTDIKVVDTGRDVGVKTYRIMSPTIYGTGLGLWKAYSIQLPTLIKHAIDHKHSAVIGDGKGVWNYVHIADLVAFYELFLIKVLQGETLREGEHGIYFTATGEFTWMKMAENVAEAGVKLDVLPNKTVKSISLEEAAHKFYMGGDLLSTELNYASNSRTKAVLSMKMGWKPQKNTEDFKNHSFSEFALLYKGI